MNFILLAFLSFSLSSFAQNKSSSTSKSASTTLDGNFTIPPPTLPTNQNIGSHFDCGVTHNVPLNTSSKPSSLLGQKGGFVGPSVVKVGVVSLIFNDDIAGSNDGNSGLSESRAQDWITKEDYSLKPFFEFNSNNQIYVSPTVQYKEIRIYEDLTYVDPILGLGYPTSDCKLGEWRNYIADRIDEFDITHLHIVLPTRANCSWLGLATGYISSLGASVTYQKGSSSSPYVINHEIGHTFGMRHSSSIDYSSYLEKYRYLEYGGSDVMATSNNTLTAPQRIRLGWLFPGETDSSSQTVPTIGVESLGQEEIFYVTDINTADSLCPFPNCSKAFRLQSFNSPGWTYFLSYRSKSNTHDQNSLAGSHHPLLYLHKDRFPVRYGNSYRIARLTSGESFDLSFTPELLRESIPNYSFLFYNEPYEIEFLESTLYWAKIKVKTQALCLKDDPTITLSDQNIFSQFHEGGSSEEFVIEITNNDSPACAVREFELDTSFPAGFVEAIGPTSISVPATETKEITFKINTPNNTSQYSSDPLFSIRVLSSGESFFSKNGIWKITNSICSKNDLEVDIIPVDGIQQLEPLGQTNFNIKITNKDTGIPNANACTPRSLSWSINNLNSAFQYNFYSSWPNFNQTNVVLNAGEFIIFQLTIQAPVDTFNHNNQNFTFNLNEINQSTISKVLKLILVNARSDLQLFHQNKIASQSSDFFYENSITTVRQGVNVKANEGENVLLEFRLTRPTADDQQICLKSLDIPSSYIQSLSGQNISAFPNVDYLPFDICKTILAGEISTFFQIKVLNDLNDHEHDEYIYFNVSLDPDNSNYINEDGDFHRIKIQRKSIDQADFKLRTYFPGQAGNPHQDKLFISWTVKNWCSYKVIYSDDFHLNPSNPNWQTLYDYPQFRRVGLSSDPQVAPLQVIENFSGIADPDFSPIRVYKVEQVFCP